MTTKDKDKLISTLVKELIVTKKKKKSRRLASSSALASKKKKTKKTTKPHHHLGSLLANKPALQGHPTNQAYNPIATAIYGGSVPITNKADYSREKTFENKNIVDDNKIDHDKLVTDIVKAYNVSSTLQPKVLEGSRSTIGSPLKIKNKITIPSKGRRSKYSSLNQTELDKAKLPEIKNKCKELGIPIKGRGKADLINALYKYRDDNQETNFQGEPIVETPNNTPIKEKYTNPLLHEKGISVSARVKAINDHTNNSWQDPNEYKSNKPEAFENPDDPKSNGLIASAMKAAKSMFSPRITRSRVHATSEVDKKINQIDDEAALKYGLKGKEAFYAEPLEED